MLLRSSYAWMYRKSRHPQWVINSKDAVFASFKWKGNLMTQDNLYIHVFRPQGQAEQEALLGFSLLTLPTGNMLRADASLLLLNTLGSNDSIVALDLRFISTETSANVAIYLFCRLRRPPQLHPEQFYKHCMIVAGNIQQVGRDCGYEFHFLHDQQTFTRALTPFQYPVVAEIRRDEKIRLVHDAFTEYETYVPYPWEWDNEVPVPFLEAFSLQRSACLVSVHIEPTRLNNNELNLLNHATNGQVREFLLQGGEQGRAIYDIYQTLNRALQRQLYLLRVSLAAPSREVVEDMGRAILFQLRFSSNAPILQFPVYAYERDAAMNNVNLLQWIPWGNLRDDSADTRRLRYLIDGQGASKVFHIPVGAPPQTAANRKIKVLLVFSSPSNMSDTRLPDEDRAIIEAIERSKYRDNISLTVRHAATILTLSRALLEDEFHIVHIAGHGTVAGIVLKNEAGRSHIVPQDVLAERFGRYYREHRSLRCVILNACNTASLGEAIVHNKVPFSIAMDGEVSSKPAIEFARGIYDALGAGKEIPHIYEEGRFRAGAFGSIAPFVPHLFSA
jgi:hypothetical protein